MVPAEPRATLPGGGTPLLKGLGAEGHPQISSKITQALSYTRAAGKSSTVCTVATPGSKGSLCIFRRLNHSTESLWAREPAARAQSKMLGAHFRALGTPLHRDWNLGDPGLGTRQKRTQLVQSLQRHSISLSGNCNRCFWCGTEQKYPPWPQISGPVTCRVLGAIQSWTDTQTRCAYPPRLLSHGR